MKKILTFLTFFHYLLAQRDFTEWLKSVPDDPEKGSGLKRLMYEVNPDVDQLKADKWTTDLTKAA